MARTFPILDVKYPGRRCRAQGNRHLHLAQHTRECPGHVYRADDGRAFQHLLCYPERPRRGCSVDDAAGFGQDGRIY
jgi:hypothetical protein